MAEDKKENEEDLKKLKERYFVLQKKYSLPSFDDLNKNFDVEKISAVESDLLIREVRRHIGERLSHLHRFAELFLSPSEGSMFIFFISKNMTQDDKKKIEELYQKIVDLEIDILKLDIEYSENDEADFIKKSWKEWKEIQDYLVKIYEAIKKSNKIKQNKTSSGYLG